MKGGRAFAALHLAAVAPSAKGSKVGFGSLANTLRELWSSQPDPQSHGKGAGRWRCSIAGVGAAAPQTVISNRDLERVVETSDSWISTRTGISNRRVLLATESLQRLAADAGRQALRHANMTGGELDAVIVASSTPEDMFGDAAAIAGLVGASGAVGWDVRAACSGFVFAVVNACQFLHTGAYKSALVIGSDALSRWVDWKDRNSCVLFGDGAGAVVVKGVATDDDAGMIGFLLNSDPSGSADLQLPRLCSGERGAPASIQRLLTKQGRSLALQPDAYGTIRMNGRKVYRFAATEVHRSILLLLEREKMSPADIDWLLLHQANSRILDAVAANLGIPTSKVLYNIQNYGNTSAASIPLALEEAVRSGRIKKGDRIVVAAFGAGLSWGATVIRWMI